MTESPPSVKQLNDLIVATLTAIRAVYGVRCSVIMAVGLPDPDDPAHDRFSAGCMGPCLMTRGLLAWAERDITEQIDRGDTSRARATAQPGIMWVTSGRSSGGSNT